MITLTEIITIIITHWVADFVFQDEKWALGKSKNWSDLLKHTLTYSYIWALLGCFVCLVNPELQENYKWVDFAIVFPLITFITHTITDYFTSRVVSKKFATGQYGSSIPNFGAFSIIGIDQVLHYVQLFATYHLLK
jgi:hypothetical protein